MKNPSICCSDHVRTADSEPCDLKLMIGTKKSETASLEGQCSTIYRWVDQFNQSRPVLVRSEDWRK